MFDLSRAFVQRSVRRQTQVMTIGPWPHGLNTFLPAAHIQETELSEIVNMKVVPTGQLETRPVLVKYSNTATTSNASVVCIEEVVLGTTVYELIADVNKILYYLDGNLDPQSIGTLESNNVVIIPYNGVAVVLDGSYIKYLDSVSEIKIAYDDGSGTSGYQWDNSSGTNDGSLPLGNGTNTRIAQKITTQSWDTGYTIPPTSMSITLTKTGTPSASAVTCNLRRVSDDSIIATAEVLSDATELTSTPTDYTALFTVTSEMSLSTEYYLSIEHSGGDASNYVNVHYTTVTSGLAYHYTGSWAADATADLIGYLKPGRPPKSSFGVVKNRRLYLNDEDNPGYVRYSNLTHLDWSTPDGGGYIGVIDNDANTFPVGGIATIYQDLVVYGKEESPYICILTGSTPSDYALPGLFQRTWTTHLTLTNVSNDIWSPSHDGVAALTGVKEYGDYRTATVSDPISDRIRDYWDSDTAMAEFYPKDGQFWLYMPDYHRVIVGRARGPVQGVGDKSLRFPWMEYEFYRDVFTDATRYVWNESSNGTNEWYLSFYSSMLGLESGDVLGTEGPQAGDVLGLESGSDIDPSIPTAPDFVTLDDEVITKGTAGSLSNMQWDYGDNDSLGFNTIYLRYNAGNPNEQGIDVRSVFAPQCFDTHDGTLFLGGSDGFVYKISQTSYVDNSLHFIKPRIAPAYYEFPFNERNLVNFQLLSSSRTGLSVDMYLYTDGREHEYTDTWTVRRGVSDELTLGEATMILRDATFTIGPGAATVPWERLNVNARSFQLKAKNIIVSGGKAYINGFLVQYRDLRL